MESHLSRAGSSAADSISFILKIKCKGEKGSRRCNIYIKDNLWVLI
jgi:hypothetical protein